MKIPPVKGTRDFYPSEMAVRNWIIDGWKRVSVRNGFEEYDGPIFEYLKMFQIKSGDEIVEQLFSLQDRGGRDLALRPEITPTLARMVNQRINSLPKPIKWFSVPRLFRAERPQKGRLREFFQWNIDIIGVDDTRADAEVIFTTIDYLREVGLTNKDIKVKISSRKLLAAVLRSIGIDSEKLELLYPLLDKKSKLSEDAFKALLEENIRDQGKVKKIIDFMAIDNVNRIAEVVNINSIGENAVEELNEVFVALDVMKVPDYCVFDPNVVRGLAYYTGIVFEVHDIAGDLRAICGGGRYDNLLRDFGGTSMPATGMGMGDCVLEILLQEKDLLRKKATVPRLDYFVACAENLSTHIDMRLVAQLRSLGYSANFSYKTGKLGRQLKEADNQNAKKCIIIGVEELKDNKLIVKDMATGEQELVSYDEFWSRLKA
ncbi:MAG TPA: histidine--tRNA ligase [Sedimentisphaerales bacterium]|nr:histidine--tRNA ligase [Sedimentisphaerales bacterium]